MVGINTFTLMLVIVCMKEVVVGGPSSSIVYTWKTKYKNMFGSFVFFFFLNQKVCSKLSIVSLCKVAFFLAYFDYVHRGNKIERKKRKKPAVRACWVAVGALCSVGKH